MHSHSPRRSTPERRELGGLAPIRPAFNLEFTFQPADRRPEAPLRANRLSREDALAMGKASCSTLSPATTLQLRRSRGASLPMVRASYPQPRKARRGKEPTRKKFAKDEDRSAIIAHRAGYFPRLSLANGTIYWTSSRRRGTQACGGIFIRRLPFSARILFGVSEHLSEIGLSGRTQPCPRGAAWR